MLSSLVVLKNEEGKYLQFYSQTTHTGIHETVTWTDDINQASTICRLPYRTRKEYNLDACERIPVRVDRKVTPLSEVKSRRFITPE